MRRNVLILILLISVVGISAQRISIKKTYAINGQTKNTAYYPVLSQDGQQLLFTSENYVGLSHYDFGTATQTKVSEVVGAGYEPSFDNNNRTILYKQETRVDGRRYKSLMSYDQSLKRSKRLIAPKRRMTDVKAVQQQRGLKKSSTAIVRSEDLQVVVYRGTKRTVLEPVGKVAGYIWVSLSPNGKMILFVAAGKGAFVSDLNGRILASLGNLSAPVWYNDNIVLGAEEKDNGDFITASTIVAVSLNGKMKQRLTPAYLIAMNPTASADAGRIAYNTQNGMIYVMDVEVEDNAK
ncbi:MAG: hypothetical protein RRY36_01770 [Bacteroidaceae bacterium]